MKAFLFSLLLAAGSLKGASPTLSAGPWIGNPAGASLRTVSITTGTGSNRALVVTGQVSNAGGNAIFTGVTFAGQSLSLIRRAQTIGGGIGVTVETWGKANPPSGTTGNVSIAVNSTDASGFVIAEYQNVDQANPFPSSNATALNSLPNAIGTTLTTVAASSLILGSFGGFPYASATLDPLLTLRGSATTASNIFIFYGDRTSTAAGAYNVSSTATGSLNALVQIAVEMQPPQPTATPTPTSTSTITQTSTRTISPSPTFTGTVTATPTFTSTITPSQTFTRTATPTPTFSSTISPTSTFTVTVTITPPCNAITQNNFQRSVVTETIPWGTVNYAPGGSGTSTEVLVVGVGANCNFEGPIQACYFGARTMTAIVSYRDTQNVIHPLGPVYQTWFYLFNPGTGSQTITPIDTGSAPGCAEGVVFAASYENVGSVLNGVATNWSSGQQALPGPSTYGNTVVYMLQAYGASGSNGVNMSLDSTPGLYDAFLGIVSAWGFGGSSAWGVNPRVVNTPVTTPGFKDSAIQFELGQACLTSTPTFTPTSTSTATPSRTATVTPTFSLTSTRTSTPTTTPSPTATRTVTPSPTRTATRTASPSPTATPSSTPACIVYGVTTPVTGGGGYAAFPAVTGNKYTVLNQGHIGYFAVYLTAAASGSIQMGLYRGPGVNPGNLAAHSGVATAVFGWNYLTASSEIINPGDYWVMMVSSNTAPKAAQRPGKDVFIQEVPTTFGIMPKTISGRLYYQRMQYSAKFEVCN